MSCCGCDDDEEQQPNPTRVRGCTDIFWLCLFIAFWCLMILIAAFALVYGNPLRLVNGSDTFGNTCGMKNNQKFGDMELSGLDTSDKPYLFFFDMKDIKHSLQICVKKCPDRQINNINDVCQFYKETGSQLCHDHPSSGFSACNSQIKNKTGYCPNLPVYESKAILNRCVPKMLKEATATFISNIYSLLNSWDAMEQILGDLYKTWREILGLSFLAFVLSLFMIGIFNYLATIVTWIIMALVSVACIGGTGLLWWTYFGIKKTLDATDQNQLLEQSIRNENAFFIFAIVATICTVILLFLVCIIRKRISFMAALFKESAKCLSELPGLFFQPLVTFAALIIFYTFWIIVFLSLLTANDAGTKPVQLSDASSNAQLLRSTDQWNARDLQKRIELPMISPKTFTFVEFVDSTWVRYMWWVHIIGLIWISEFITSCQVMVTAGAVAHWYFRGKDASASPVCSAMGNLVSYHLGSVACGSFLITIFKLPRLILTYLHQKFERTKENSPCAQCGLKCCICCFFCLEKFIRFMNHNAYTVVAIEGTNFCNAARIAFTTIVSNALQIAVINGIGDFVLFLGKCFVMASTGSIALLLMRQDPRLHFYAAPIVVVCGFSFFIAHCVISLYENHIKHSNAVIFSQSLGACCKIQTERINRSWILTSHFLQNPHNSGLSSVIDTLFLCICEDKNLHGENGKWRQSPLAQFDVTPNGEGHHSHELAPINN